VSGLLWQREEASRARFGLADSHRTQVNAIARAALESAPDMHLVLVSHVEQPRGAAESDLDAAEALAASLRPDFPGRVEVLPQDYTPSELKWVISRLDWFAGARMHATIGAFSSGVPTLGLGYSDKARGVFDECGLTGQVADLRTLDASALAERVAMSIANRADTRTKTAKVLPGVKTRAAAMMDALTCRIAGLPA
jgi:polysaccharide pyruvyl transferase WcaK-like protein